MNNHPIISEACMSKNSINLHKFCLILGIFFLWWITYCEGKTLPWFWKTTYKTHIQSKTVFTQFSSWWSQSSFFPLSTALTYYVHLSNSMGNDRHYQILGTLWKANAGFDQECDDKEFALGFFHVLESQFAYQFLSGGEWHRFQRCNHLYEILFHKTESMNHNVLSPGNEGG